MSPQWISFPVLTCHADGSTISSHQRPMMDFILWEVWISPVARTVHLLLPGLPVLSKLTLWLQPSNSCLPLGDCIVAISCFLLFSALLFYFSVLFSCVVASFLMPHALFICLEYSLSFVTMALLIDRVMQRKL
jgi:hypothetical protein